MRPSITQLYPVFALLMLAGGTVWLERITRGEEAAARAEQRRDADFVAERTRLISYGADGKQRYELLADRITNYPQSDVTELERPRLHYASEGRELQASARTGEVRNAGEEVRLRGDVRLRRSAGDGRPDMTFASDTLQLWPDDERAETASPVVLTQGASVTHAGGLKADNVFGTLDLLGGVTARMPRSSRTRP